MLSDFSFVKLILKLHTIHQIIIRNLLLLLVQNLITYPIFLHFELILISYQKEKSPNYVIFCANIFDDFPIILSFILLIFKSICLEKQYLSVFLL